MPGNRQVFTAAINAADHYRWDSQWAQALQEYQRALAEFPDDATARSGLGFCYMQTKQWQLALNEYENILQRDPGNVIALSKMAELYGILNRRADAYIAYMHLAELYAQASQGARAEATWQKAVQLSPDSPEPHERLANYYFEKKDIALMFQHRLQAAQGYLARNELEAARVQCEEVLRADGNNIQAQQLLSRILEGQSASAKPMPSGAQATSSQGSADGTVPSTGLSSDPLSFTGNSLAETVTLGNTSGGNTSIMGNMGSAGNFGGVGNPGSTPTMAGPGGGMNSAPRKRITASQVTGVLKQAQTFQAQGRFNDAIDLCEQILESGFDRPDARYFLGWLYQEQQRWDEAIHHFQMLLNDPDYALSCYYSLGQCYRARGDLRTATVHFDEAVDRVNLDALTAEESDQLVQLCQEAAEAHRLLGEQEQALTVYNALLGFLRSRGWNEKVAQVEFMLQQAQHAPSPARPITPPAAAAPHHEQPGVQQMPPQTSLADAATMAFDAATINNMMQQQAAPAPAQQSAATSGELPDWLTGILNEADKTQIANKPPAASTNGASGKSPAVEQPMTPPVNQAPAAPPAAPPPPVANPLANPPAAAPKQEQPAAPSWLTGDPAAAEATVVITPEQLAAATQQYANPSQPLQGQPSAPHPVPGQAAGSQSMIGQAPVAPQPSQSMIGQSPVAPTSQPLQGAQPASQPLQAPQSQPLPGQQPASQPLQAQPSAPYPVPGQVAPQPSQSMIGQAPVAPQPTSQPLQAPPPPVAQPPIAPPPVQMSPVAQPSAPLSQPALPVAPPPAPSLDQLYAGQSGISSTQPRPAQSARTGAEDLLQQMAGSRDELQQVADAVLESTAVLPENIRMQVVRSMQDIQNYINHGLLTSATEECLRIIDMAPQYLDVHQVLCEIYVRQGKIEQAITKYAILVDTYVVNGRVEDAIATYRRILQLEPNNLTYRMRLINLLSTQGNKEDLLRERTLAAESYLRLGYMDRALTELEQALQESPTSVSTRLNYALALQKLGRIQQAVAEYQRVLQIDPRNITALVRWHIAMITSVGTPRPTTLEVLTRIRWQLRGEGQKHAEAVLREYSQSAEIYPNNADVHFSLGQIYQQSGHFDKAVDEYILAMQDHGIESLARISAAYCLLQQGKPENAIQQYEQALHTIRRAAVPVDPSTWAARPREEGEEHKAPEIEISLLLAKAYGRVGKQEQMQAILRQVKQTRTDQNEVASTLAEISSRQTDIEGVLREYLELVNHYRNSRQTDSAISVLKEMVRVMPQDPRAHEELADIYEKRGLLDESVAELRLLSDIYLRLNRLEEAGDALQRIGTIYDDMGDSEEALVNLCRAVELKPNSMDLLREIVGFCWRLERNDEAAQYQARIARYYFETHQVKESVAALQQLIAIDRDNFEAYDMLGQTYQSVGEYEQASRVYKNLAKVNPGSGVARERLATLQELRTR
ncbi:tetratricopeptide repeat protein [Ktedonosporobacter rubrisoli]|uniref:Tetratricopeptide repeat protein n=1 Tax=Ktedonosporobacter rubrisoli TaxID=2509675 RepID=A0A4P6JZJ0_KTERU|nr:tetratricopeptide repeat protein [Ktedonosporobacter rubrisoli]QBD80912.1 tetratricopeptide repeat protein [Ktedonosporobacter rubrisoli]